MYLFFLRTDSILSYPSMVLALKILIGCLKKDIWGWGWFHNAHGYTLSLYLARETNCVTVGGVILWNGYNLIRYEKEQYQECQYEELSVTLLFNPQSAILSS